MAGGAFIRYFPTLLIGLIILFIGILADQQHAKVVKQERWERVGSRVDAARSRFERLIEADIRSANRLAAILGPIDSLDQPTFETFVADGFVDQPEVIRTELAPEFSIAFVTPLVGNQERLGVDLREVSMAGGPDLGVRSSRNARFQGPLRLEDGTSVLRLQVPLLSHHDGRTTLEGVFSVLLDIEELLRQSGIPDATGDVEYAIFFEDDRGEIENLLFGSPEIAGSAPVSSEITLPSGSWTVLATPVEGWDRSWREKLSYRFWIAVVGATVLLPALLANGYAVARRRSITDLETTEARLSGVLRNMPGAVFSYTLSPERHELAPNDSIRFFNTDACRDIWGLEALDADANLSILWQLGADQEEVEALKSSMIASAKDLKPWHSAWQIRSTDGTAKWLDGRGHPTRLPDGSTRWYCLIVDATREMERSAELERQRELTYLAQKNDSIGKLTGGVAHDFNNLLAVIMGNQELLREALEADSGGRPELLEYIESSLQATERGADLTRKMLSFAQRARLEPAVLDINDLVRETYAWAGRTMPSSIELKTSLGEALPLVRIDRGSAESALLNLMVNARDAMPDGGRLSIETSAVEVTETDAVCREQELAPGRYVRLVLSDSGKGIPAEVLPRIFEPFFTTKPPTAGSGLGLSMVMGFMEQSGGAVRATSQPGVRTAFELYFKALETQAKLREATPKTPSMAAGARARILLAEDEPDVRKVLVSTLKIAGYDVLEAASGDIGFEMFKSAPDVDLLLTDIVMPGALQGTDLAQAIRCMSPDLPVIFLSGYAAEADPREPAIETDDVRLTKPVARHDLVAAIERKLGAHDRASPPPERPGQGA